MAGYLAFGATVDEIILYNLPDRDTTSVIAKIFYIFCISGSYVILSQPGFYVVENSTWYQNLVHPKSEKFFQNLRA